MIINNCKNLRYLIPCCVISPRIDYAFMFLFSAILVCIKEF